jgi:hypothetical protein
MRRTVKGLILRRSLGIALTLVSLLVALALMIDEAIRGTTGPLGRGLDPDRIPARAPGPGRRRPAARPEPYGRRQLAEDRFRDRSDLALGRGAVLGLADDRLDARHARADVVLTRTAAAPIIRDDVCGDPTAAAAG